MRTFRRPNQKTFSWCVREDHWTDGTHPLGDLSDPANPGWDISCRLNSTTVPVEALLSISDGAANGEHIIGQCLSSEESTEVVQEQV